MCTMYSIHYLENAGSDGYIMYCRTPSYTTNPPPSGSHTHWTKSQAYPGRREGERRERKGKG